MGQVWAASGPGDRRPLAIKLLTGRGPRDPQFNQAFRNEVRAASSLDHPNVVVVYDYGEADGRSAAASGGQIVAGTPYLVMERVDGTTLAPLCGRIDWEDVRSVLQQLLAALAHAHARGVIHRDLKPANVLVMRSTNTVRVKLTDFGLAHAYESSEDPTLGGGTPSYMAPEQFTGTWRDFGPWTDLYGLGCLVWCLVRGEPPWGTTRSVDEKRRQHLREPPPPLRPVVPVPAGFESWVRALLEKDPLIRFRRAADALEALESLSPAVDQAGPVSLGMGSMVGAGVSIADADTGVDTLPHHSFESSGEITLVREPSGGRLPLLRSTPSALATIRPPIPATWRERYDYDAWEAAGVGLYGLRVVPLVGRDAERDALWAALQRVHGNQKAELVLLAGPSGSGKSRLAQWLCERADELGAALVMRASHGPVPGAVHGVGAMIANALRCQNLDREDVGDRVEEIYRARNQHHRDEWEAITELIAPGQGAGGVRFQSAAERYIPIRRLLQGMTAERPVVMWLDDVQWGQDALGLAAYLLDMQARHPAPVLMVLTATEETLAEREQESLALESLVRRPGATRIDVGPLAPEHRTRLIRNLLGLDADLARQVEERTAGNPLFAVQLVGDWVQRRLLEAGPSGYRLKRGVEAELPADVRAVWGTRVARLLKNRPIGQVMALELAAILGTDVDTGEWQDVCARGGAEPADSLVDALLDARLAIAGARGPSTGWSFAHAMLRETLEDNARQAGRLEAHHLKCAEELGARAAPQERVARHLVGAGRVADAVGPMFVAAESRVNLGDYASGEGLLGERDALLARLGLPPSDARWGEGWLLRHDVARRRGEVEAALGWLDRAEQAAHRFEWPSVQVRALVYRARIARWQGDIRDAVALTRDAGDRARKSGDARWVAEARLETALACKMLGDLEAAIDEVHRAYAVFDEIGDATGSARCVQVLGQTYKQAGRHKEAAAMLEKAERLFGDAGNRFGQAQCLNSRGDVLRFGGDLEGASALYRRSRGLYRTVGGWEYVYPEMNLAHILLIRRQFSAAEEMLEELTIEFERLGNRAVLADLHLGLALCAADAGRWLAFDDHLREANQQLDENSNADEDTARLARLAAERAIELGERGRALDALRLGRDQWRALGRVTERNATEAEMRRLVDGT